MVDLKRYRATSGERNFIERIKALVFFGGSFSNRDDVRAKAHERKLFRGTELKLLEKFCFIKTCSWFGQWLTFCHLFLPTS